MTDHSRRAARAASLLVAALLAGCARGVVEPPTYGDRCDGDSDCEAPLRCLPAAEPRFCTLTCASDSDCPMVRSEGHCEGEVRAQCDPEAGLCRQLLCE